jgi:hypothetical protein
MCGHSHKGRKKNCRLEISPMRSGVFRLSNINLGHSDHRRLPNGTLQPRAQFHVLPFCRFPRDLSCVWGHTGNRPLALLYVLHLTSSSPLELLPSGRETKPTSAFTKPESEARLRTRHHDGPHYRFASPGTPFSLKTRTTYADTQP